MSSFCRPEVTQVQGLGKEAKEAERQVGGVTDQGSKAEKLVSSCTAVIFRTVFLSLDAMLYSVLWCLSRRAALSVTQ